MKVTPLSVVLTLVLVSAISACSKNNSTPEREFVLSYGDSIIYLQPTAGDYIIHPLEHRAGTYSGFPEGIEIDEETGAIDVSDSETGLRYLITHTSPSGRKTQTKIVLSGITFTDRYYRLSQNDSIASPVYNASPYRQLPLTGSSFDEGGLANSGGCSVKTTNGQINLAETIRNGVFGATPENDKRETFEIRYRLNDASGKAENRLKVLLYYYETMADVPEDVLETLRDREEQGVFLKSGGALGKVAKPRPPCVIIIAN